MNAVEEILDIHKPKARITDIMPKEAIPLRNMLFLLAVWVQLMLSAKSQAKILVGREKTKRVNDNSFIESANGKLKPSASIIKDAPAQTAFAYATKLLMFLGDCSAMIKSCKSCPV